ncbi:pilus assembly protein PilP [Parasulfuritortus cantonensis]|uniref:pilus assembly protein PilP n=1 Tax=Parasulfuritortus cantonensis TaxID=2528202 RepID=UPI0014052A0A|nr:pilus assembly protein PilP [Parasulfuritortus cantonensis]
MLSLALLSGCGDDGFDDLRTFMAETGKDGGAKIEPLPAIKKVDAFVYQGDGLLDPFAARTLRPTGKGAPDASRPREPLEEFPLDALRMVGTLKKPGQPVRAVVKDPKGTLHMILVGGHIGQNYGKVTAIHEDGLDISELIQDANGEWAASKAVMSMTQDTQ